MDGCGRSKILETTEPTRSTRECSCGPISPSGTQRLRLAPEPVRQDLVRKTRTDDDPSRWSDQLDRKAQIADCIDDARAYSGLSQDLKTILEHAEARSSLSGLRLLARLALDP